MPAIAARNRFGVLSYPYVKGAFHEPRALGPVKNWNLVNGRNVSSERSANFIHGSLLAIQLGGFRFISDKFRYEIRCAAPQCRLYYPVAANTSW